MHGHLGAQMDFATGFGLGEGESDYSQAVFEVNYGTSVWASFWKLLQPLLVVMTMVDDTAMP